MRKADIYAQWQAQLDAHNAQPETGEGKAAYTCRRCGGTFERKAGKPPPSRCPACGLRGWLDPDAKTPPLRWTRKLDGGG